MLHRALVEVIARRFDRSLMPHDFACRVGFGGHRAVLHLQRAMAHHRFCVHLDVRAYFPSIDGERLAGLVASRARDDRFMAVVRAALAQGPPLYRRADVRRFTRLTDAWPPPGRGIPIGTSLSQYLAAHVYLLRFDHWLKRTLRVPAVCRYVDDIFIFGDRRADLRRWRAAIGQWLLDERGLRLKHPKARVLSCGGHLDALGYRITRGDRAPLPRVFRQVRRRVRDAMAGRPGPDIERSLAASAGVVVF